MQLTKYLFNFRNLMCIWPPSMIWWEASKPFNCYQILQLATLFKTCFYISLTNIFLQYWPIVQSFPHTLFCLLVLIFCPTRIFAHQSIFLSQFCLYHSIFITLHQIYTIYIHQSTHTPEWKIIALFLKAKISWIATIHYHWKTW